jgi:hypothetical protein
VLEAFDEFQERASAELSKPILQRDAPKKAIPVISRSEVEVPRSRISELE